MKLLALVLSFGLAMGSPALVASESVDPLESARWGDMRKLFFGTQQLVFDDRVKVIGPADAENPMQVPITVDATALGSVQEVLVFADFNPILQILRFFPQRASAFLGFRIKLQQSSPVRAAALTSDGVWHLGGTWINTVGGGCTAPSAASAAPEWQRRLNEVSGRQWTSGPMSGRVRMRIIHPMDTGLVAGIPAFYLEDIEFLDPEDRLLMRVQPFEPVSENPVFTVQQVVAGPVRASGRDNNGNTFSVLIAP